MPPASKAKSAASRADEMSSTLAALRRHGGPVEVKRGGKTVAVVMTPQELEALEDQIDASLLRQALRNPDPEPLMSLEDVAADWGVDLKSTKRGG